MEGAVEPTDATVHAYEFGQTEVTLLGCRHRVGG
jgi:hypothetical protein